MSTHCDLGVFVEQLVLLELLILLEGPHIVKLPPAMPVSQLGTESSPSFSTSNPAP